jgi:hypothetical protein
LLLGPLKLLLALLSLAFALVCMLVLVLARAFGFVPPSEGVAFPAVGSLLPASEAPDAAVLQCK